MHAFPGGSTLYIETCCRPVPKASSSNDSSDSAQPPATLEVTGNLGDVMKESSRIAYTYAKNFLATLQCDENKIAAEFLLTNNVHLHVPEVKLLTKFMIPNSC